MSVEGLETSMQTDYTVKVTNAQQRRFKIPWKFRKIGCASLLPYKSWDQTMQITLVKVYS